MFELLDPPLSLLERVRLLADQLVAEGHVVGEGDLGVVHGRYCMRKHASDQWGQPEKFRKLCGIADVAWSSLDALEIDAIEQHDQVGRVDRHAGRFGFARSREPERAFFQTFVNDEKSIGIPEEQLDAIAATIPKNEEMTAQGILPEHALDKMRETVEPLAHVRRFPCQEDADGGRQAQHRRASSTERTASRAIGSKPRVTRTVGPAGSTISIGVVAAIGSAASCTTRTGKNAEGTGQFGRRVRAFDCPGRWDLTIAASQRLTPPVEVPGLQALTLAESPDGQPAAGLVGDRTPPELFLDGISAFPASRLHGHLPEIRTLPPGNATRPCKMGFATRLRRTAPECHSHPKASA